MIGKLVHRPSSRREFLRGALRYLALAGLASMTGALWARSRSAAPTTCISPGVGSCHRCPVLRGCDLEAALAARAAGKDEHDAG